MIRHMLRYLGLVPITVHALGGNDQHGVDLAFVVQHSCVVDEHEALASAHVR